MKRLGIYLGFPPHGGGAFQYAYSTLLAAAALPPDEYEIVVVHTHPAWAIRIQDMSSRVMAVTAKSGALESVVAALLRLGFPARVWRRISNYIQPLVATMHRQKCDLWLFPAQEYLAYAIQARTVGVVHDLMHRHEPSFPEVSSFGLFRRRERHYRNLCEFAAAILVDSEVGRRHVIEAYGPPGNKIHVLPYPAPDRLGQSDSTRPLLELPDKYVFYPAQMWKHKNHVRLIRALAQVRQTIPDLHLVLVGSEKNGGPDATLAIKQLGLESCVHRLGYVTDNEMAELYGRATALVMPTFFGPTNIPPLEAMSLGCPAIVSDIYGMRDQLGDAAEYVDPTSVESISQAIESVAGCEERRRELKVAGLKRSLELSQRNFNSCFADIIRSVTAE